jgi:hypothetical protein
MPLAAISLRDGLARIARNDEHRRGDESRPFVERRKKRSAKQGARGDSEQRRPGGPANKDRAPIRQIPSV